MSATAVRVAAEEMHALSRPIATRYAPFPTADGMPKSPCQEEFVSLMRCMSEDASRCVERFASLKACLKVHGIPVVE